MPKTVVLTLRPEVAADVRRYAPLAARTAGLRQLGRRAIRRCTHADEAVAHWGKQRESGNLYGPRSH